MPIVFQEVSHAYPTDPTNLVLEQIQFQIEEGQFVGIIGPTGSGKSTLLQHFNAILRPTAGRIQIMDFVVQAGDKPRDLKQLRKRVGLVFQFPEQQLFAETVELDLCFGPRNFGATVEEARERAVNALQLVGLPPELMQRSPFQLSGGQMRKVAIATVLAMNPDVVVLDEPTATLDPASRVDFLDMLHRLCREQQKTVIVVTHRLDEVLPFTDKLLVMHQGQLAFEGTNLELYQQLNAFRAWHMAIPKPFQIVHACEQATGETLKLAPGERAPFTIDWVSQQLNRLMKAWRSRMEGGVADAAEIHLR